MASAEIGAPRSDLTARDELEADLTAKYGIIDKAPAYDDMVRGGST